jgi:hypothetical protein
VLNTGGTSPAATILTREGYMASSTRRANSAIAISIGALLLTGWQTWESHRQVVEAHEQLLEARELRRQANEATVKIDTDTDPGDNKFGFAVRNVGPGVATIKTVKYFVDGVLVSDVNVAVEAAKLDSNRLRETELTDDAMAPGENIWILRFNARKADQDRAADFFENHLNAAVDYCSAGGRCATACADEKSCDADKIVSRP